MEATVGFLDKKSVRAHAFSLVMGSLLWALFAGPVGFSAFAQEQIINFNNRESLAELGYKPRNGAVVRAARYTFVSGRPPDAYREDGVLFLNGVVPPDPNLGPIPQPEYHLMYEEAELNDLRNQSPDRLPNPENHPRYLTPHLPGAVIQLTYDPNNDGIADPFTLKRIHVLDGMLNVGIKSNRFGIAVYNNLTPGEWVLLDGNNITRATLELPRLENLPPGTDIVHAGGFAVDDIVFEPFSPDAGRGGGSGGGQGASSAALVEDRFSRATPPFVEPSSLDLFNADNTPSPLVDVIPDSDFNRIDINSQESIEVAIVTTEGFDAASIDPSSVRFGPNQVQPIESSSGDVNEDGVSDLLFLVQISELGLQCADTQLSLEAQTFDAEPIIGADFITVRGCSESITHEVGG